MACRHLRSDGYAEPRCAAFPSGIPKAIWLGRHDHTTPYPGDRSIKFEPLEIRGVARWASNPIPAPRPCTLGSKRRLAPRPCCAPYSERSAIGVVISTSAAKKEPDRSGSLEFRAASINGCSGGAPPPSRCVRFENAVEQIARATPRRPPRVGRRTPCAARAPRSRRRPGSSPPGRLAFRRDPFCAGSPLPVARSPFRSSREYRPRPPRAQAAPRRGC